jgi:propanol-preferring alcohol dehydrogenase
MAEFMLVPSARLLLPLGDLDPRDAAPLSDAALTPYHAIKRSLGLLRPGSTAVVIGVGGLGHMAVQLLAALSPARIVGVDVNPAHLEVARGAGAQDGFVPEEAVEAIRALTRGLGAELVLDVVGSEDTMALAAAVARVEGHLTVLGLAGGTFSWAAMGVLPWECELTSTYWGTAIELMEVLDLARAGHIRAHVERFTLDHVEDAYEALREGRLEGRAVVCPAG